MAVICPIYYKLFKSQYLQSCKVLFAREMYHPSLLSQSTNLVYFIWPLNARINATHQNYQGFLMSEPPKPESSSEGKELLDKDKSDHIEPFCALVVLKHSNQNESSPTKKTPVTSPWKIIKA